MKIPQILKAIEQIDGWYLTEKGEIRRPSLYGYVQCPISALGNRSLTWAHEAMNQFDVNKKDGYAIANASDNRKEMDVELRRKLLKATRLEGK